MTIKTKSKMYILFGIFIAVYALMFLFFVYPVYNDIKSESSKLTSQKKDIFSMQEQVKQLEQFNQSKNVYKADFNKADGMLVDSKNPVVFIEFLEKIAKETSISLNITLMPVADYKTAGESWQTISFQLSSSGSLFGILTFMNKIENSPYLISIQNLKINKKQAVSGKGSLRPLALEADYNIKVYSK